MERTPALLLARKQPKAGSTGRQLSKARAPDVLTPFRFFLCLSSHVVFRSSVRDHLNVTSVPASTFDLFADPATCATSCQAALGLSDEEHADALGKAKRSGMIQLAMHHHQLEQREAAEAAAARSHSKRPHATPKKPHHEAHPKKLVE